MVLGSLLATRKRFKRVALQCRQKLLEWVYGSTNSVDGWVLAFSRSGLGSSFENRLDYSATRKNTSSRVAMLIPKVLILSLCRSLSSASSMGAKWLMEVIGNSITTYNDRLDRNLQLDTNWLTYSAIAALEA